MPEHERTPALHAEGLARLHTTSRGETVGVHGVGLGVESGEVVALLGPNGSGKSTLLGMLATIDRPDRGTVRIAGHTLLPRSGARQRRKARQHLGIVFQSSVLDPLLTIRENLVIAGSLHSAAPSRTRIDELLGEFGILDRANDRVGRLSGGLARRADIARAMLHAPSVLLLDEATAGLDPDARASLLATIGRLKALPDAPAILHTTHLTDEAEQADRVLIMDRGVIAASGTPGELTASLGESLLVLDQGGAAPDHDAGMLRKLGLAVRASDTQRTIASMPGDAPEQLRARIVGELISAGRRFRFGPASLADVYSAAVGGTVPSPEKEAAP